MEVRITHYKDNTQDGFNAIEYSRNASREERKRVPLGCPLQDRNAAGHWQRTVHAFIQQTLIEHLLLSVSYGSRHWQYNNEEGKNPVPGLHSSEEIDQKQINEYIT